MAPHTTCLSIVSLLLINQLKSQTGEGCFFTTCPETGQVRINAVYNGNGDFVGGCNCGCSWGLYDPSSPSYCSEPHEVNFDPVSLIGDCSCGPKVHRPTEPPVPPPTPQPPLQPIPMPAPALPLAPIQPPILPQTPGLPQLPTLPALPSHPIAPAPMATKPPVVPMPIEVLCDSKAPCACPIGHQGRCTLICDGFIDACKDTLIECNNDGFPCEVHCNAENACAGAASVMGPAGAALEVLCLGEKSCEGSTQFNGEAGTDMTVLCEGITSCKGVQFNFGSAVSYIECNGEPDSCIGAVFNLLPNARTTPGAAYECVGSFCPEVGTFAPEPFSNVVPGSNGGCKDVGSCSCPIGLNKPCELTCNSHPDACKDGVISCNSDGFACVVNCMSEQACSGSATIVGPRDASLTVNCIGAKACEGSIVIVGVESTDLTVICEGGEACKGNIEVNFGSGVGALYCNGNPDSCEGLIVNLLPDSAAFSCNGPFCPLDLPPAFNGPQTRIDIVPAPLPAGVVPSPIAPAPVVPLPAPAVPAPLPAVPAPLPAQPAPLPAPVAPAPAVSNYCCLTSIPNFKPWAGRCWDETSEIGCSAEPNGRCIWNAGNCLPNPPVNSYSSIGCRFYDQLCADNSQCCSETCNVNGLCR